MTELSDRTIRKFNPGTFQSDAEVISQFVVRERELAIVLEVLNDNLGAPSCQHTLLVAPRGRGKTMLLARVAAELRARSALAERLLPVHFMEESQEILDSGDFWLEALFHLAAEISKSDSALAQELRAAHEDLAARWQGDELDLRARSTVLDTADRLGRQLVLMVENLQDLCGDVDDDFGWKLRAVLQTEPQIMLLATATSRFEALDDPEQPFFELFRTLRLEPLDPGECWRLWQMVVSGDDVIERQIRPLQILTGGNPRLLVIVAQFASHRSLRQLMEDLVTLIDDHTEYFRSHLQGIAKTERRVYLSVIDLWQPSSTAEITARSRLDVRTVSAMLGRLANRGAISVEGSGRKRRYAAAERLYSIYYKLRRQRDEAAVIQNLIRFMTAFYSGPELADTIGKISIEATQEPAIQEGIERAGAEDPQIAELFSSLSQPSIDEVSVSAHLTNARTFFYRVLILFHREEYTSIIEICDKLMERYGNSKVRGIQKQVVNALFYKGVTLMRQGESAAGIEAYDALVERYGESDILEVHKVVANALFNKGVGLARQGEHEAEIEVYDELIERYRSSDIPGVHKAVAKALFNKGVELARQGEYESELEVYDELVERYGESDIPEVQEEVAKAMVNKGVELSRQGEHEAEFKVYDELIERHGEKSIVQVQIARALFNRGVDLSRQGDHESKIKVYDELVERYVESDIPEVQEAVAKAMVNTGIELTRQGEYEPAIRVYNGVIKRFMGSDVPHLPGQVAKALVNKGIILWQKGDYAAEFRVYDRLVHRYGKSQVPDVQEQVAKSLVVKGVTLWNREEFAAVIEVYDELVDRYGDSDVPEVQEQVAMALASKARALIMQGDYRAALYSFRAGYTGFSLAQEITMRQVQQVVIELATIEAQQREVLDILLMDSDKSAKLRPLVVALRKELGEQVRAPAEVMDVAEDIIKEIERRRASKAAMAVSADPKEGHGAPADQGTTILIDRKEYHVPWAVHGKNVLTGLEIRRIADPPVDHRRDLFEIVAGGSDRKVDDDTKVDIRDGIRFFTAPRQINPGRGRQA